MGVRNVLWPRSSARICDPRCQENETPARVSSGRKSSMVLCYVKGGSFVKPFFDVESTPSGQPGRRRLPGVASAVSGFLWLDSLDSRRNPHRAAGLARKALKLSQNLQQAGWSGFQVDSPVKRPVARKLAR